MKNTNKFKEEPQIVDLKDLGVDEKEIYPKEFKCPKCASRAIALDPDFVKNNVTNSIEETTKSDGVKTITGDTLVADILVKLSKKVVLICTNCLHRDLLLGFLVDRPKAQFIPFGEDPFNLTPKKRKKPYYNTRPHLGTTIKYNKC